MRGQDRCGHDSQPDLERRLLLAGLTAVYLAGKLPPAMAQPALESEKTAFINISSFLTGRSSLDPDSSARLYEALTLDNPQFGADLRELLIWVREHKIHPAELQKELDASAPRLANLPPKIMTAWYTGIVGEGAGARCVTFETSLMHQLVADRLDPPSYCYGPHGSWGNAPV